MECDGSPPQREAARQSDSQIDEEADTADEQRQRPARRVGQIAEQGNMQRPGDGQEAGEYGDREGGEQAGHPSADYGGQDEIIRWIQFTPSQYHAYHSRTWDDYQEVCRPPLPR